MKINVKKPLIHFDGKPIALQNKDGSLKENVTLGVACIDVLMTVFEDEKNLSGHKKMARHKLAEKIYNAGETEDGIVDFSIDELSELKMMIGKAYGPILVGPIYRILENKPKVVSEMTEEDSEIEQ